MMKIVSVYSEKSLRLMFSLASASCINVSERGLVSLLRNPRTSPYIEISSCPKRGSHRLLSVYPFSTTFVTLESLKMLKQ